MKSPLRIGVIGHGALAHELTAHLSRTGEAATIVGYLLRNGDRRGQTPGFYDNLEGLLRQAPQVVVECAGQAALAQYAQAIVDAGVHLVPASVGALADDTLRHALLAAARASGAQIRVPSGAMVGIDGLAAARHVGINSVLYRGTMPPTTLQGHYDGELPAAGLVFEGCARQAVQRFPKNANLTGTIALAGIGFEDTRVEMLVDPSLTANVHELMARGAFGDFHVTVKGIRISEQSPSSRIVAGSLAQAALGANFLLLS